MSSGGIVVPEQEPEPTEASLKEASAIARGDLRRHEALQSHIHRAGLLVFWIAVSVAIILGLIWAWHLSAPEKWRFLDTEQRQDLQLAHVSMLGSSFVTQASRRWFKNPADRN